jgi:hypothetical protein
MESTKAIPIHCAHHAVVSIHELKPHPKNPKKHPQKQLVVYAEAIRNAGWRKAVHVSRRSGFIVSGCGAVEAARLVPTDQIPVEYQDYESDAAELADLLAQNRIGELGTMDKDLVKDVLAAVAQADTVKSIVTGYSAEAVAKLFKVAPAAPQYPIVARLNEEHHLLCVPVESATDWQFLKNLVGIRVEQSYKNATVGESHVVSFARFLQSLRENLHSLTQTGGDNLDSPAGQ